MKIILLILLLIIMLVSSCRTVRNSRTNSIFEILSEQKDGGASIEFYEIITDAKELKILLNDKNLKNKIQEKDIETCNFVIVNSGYQNKDNNKIEIESVLETIDKIIIKVKKKANTEQVDIELGTVNPYLILKINSKKEIVFE